MDWKDVKGLIGKVAPSLATALGGPLAGAAVSALSDAFGLSEAGTPEQKQDALVAAISGATPDQLLALKKTDQEFAIKMQELGFKNVEELEKFATADRDSARNREIVVKDNTPKVLVYAITLGFFGVLATLMFGDVPSGSKEVLYIMLGTLGTAWTAGINYYFGSTNGSSEKNKLLLAATPATK